MPDETKKTPSGWRNVEIEQQIKYGFTIDFIESVLPTISYLKDYAYIVHDKDLKADGTLKEPHIHLMMKFLNPVPTDNILKKFDKTVLIEGVEYKTVNAQNLEKCKKWSSAIAYLTHSNSPDKFQYSDSEVISNFDTVAEKDKALYSKNKLVRKNEILQHIDNEIIRPYNYTEYISADEYISFKKDIDNAFKYVYDRCLTVRRNRNMDVFFFYGPSGSGKTTYAKWFCEDNNLSYCVSSSSNDPLQDYRGEDALILDDFRSRDWSLSDILKLLDNNTSSTGKSRYSNKNMCYCKVIIITSSVSPDDTYKYFQGRNLEQSKQWFRRINGYYLFADASSPVNIILCENGKPVKKTSIPHPFTLLENVGRLSDDQKLSRLMGFIGSTKFEDVSDCSNIDFNSFTVPSPVDDVPPVDDDLPNPFA